MVSAYTVNKKNSEGKFEKVSKLFANKDGSFGNKKDGIELRLAGKYPDLLVNGEAYGKTFLNTSKATGNSYYVAKNTNDGDLYLFEDKPRTASATGGNGAVKPSFSKPSFQKKA